MGTKIHKMQYQGPLPEESVTVFCKDMELVLDLKALLSNYECIYGEGCCGTEPFLGEGKNTERFQDLTASGCCRTGPGFGTGDDLPDRIIGAVHDLTAEDAENIEEIEDGWYFPANKSRSYDQVATHKGNCVFLNSDKHDKPGCALWHYANRVGKRPQDVRPKVCHTEPLMVVEIGDAETVDGKRYLLTLRPYWHGWFNPNGWWCTKDKKAFRAKSPVYQRMFEQICWLVAEEENHVKIKEALDQAWKESGPRQQENWGNTVFLPEPKWFPKELASITAEQQRRAKAREEAMSKKAQKDKKD